MKEKEFVAKTKTFKDALNFIRDNKVEVGEITAYDLDGNAQRVFSWNHPEYQQSRPFNRDDNFIVQSIEGYEDDELTGKRGKVLLLAEHPWYVVEIEGRELLLEETDMQKIPEGL
jgi:hypothetical protein